MTDAAHSTTGERADLRETSAKETRQLEDILVAYQRITDRLGRIDDKLDAMCCRLSGDVLREVVTEGAEPPLAGLIGSFSVNIGLAFRRLDSVDEWLTHIEKVV